MSESFPHREQLPEPNEAQAARLRVLCTNYGVEYAPEHYFVYPPDAIMMPGYAEGFVGGAAIQKDTPTIFIGVSPEGESYS